MATAEHDHAVLPGGTRPGVVTLAVVDLQAVQAFYQQVLGLAVTRREEGAVELGAGTEPLVRLTAGAREPRVDRAPGLYHVAVRLPERAALGAWLSHALALGAPLQGAADHGVSEAVYLPDAEGNGVEVYRDRPREEWQVTGGRVHMVTEPLDARGVVGSSLEPWQGAPAATTVGHVHLQVAELERSRAFYADALGLPVTNAGFPGACFLGAGGYHHHLGLNSWGVLADAHRRLGAPGLVEFELLLPSTADVEAAAARLRLRGADVEEDAQRLRVADPDGIQLCVRAAGQGGAPASPQG